MADPRALDTGAAAAAPADGAPVDSALKILISSDTHLGYAERDPIRRNDSFESFAEMFALANEHQVDMVLLAGDLFHDNKPSRRALQKCLEIMREHCLGDRPVALEVCSDPKTHFSSKFNDNVNFEDPNYNVQLPVFSIHGNHDDPAGDGGLAPLDLMAAANLVNYFGRQDNFEKINLKPVLIKKGSTKLALYGLGHVRDERLGRCFERKEVRCARPTGADKEEWFNILAIHQNRMPRGAGAVAKGYIKDEQLPGCMDLVVWGHEHECCIGGGMGGLVESAGHKFTVLQPGSTVATALVEGEAKPKHVGLLQIQGDNWTMEALPLKTVRPFVMGDVCLKEHEEDALVNLHDENGLMDFLAERVEALITQLRDDEAARAEARGLARGAAVHAAEPGGGEEKQRKLPLVRLRVDYEGFTTCNPQRFGQRFVDKVANPGEILLFQRTKIKRKLEREAAEARKRAKASGVGGGGGGGDGDDDGMLDAGVDELDPAQSAAEIQRLMSTFMSAGKDSLRLLPAGELNTALFHEFVARDNKAAIRNSVEAMLKRTQAFLAGQGREVVDSSANRKDQESAIEKRLEHAASGRSPGLGNLRSGNVAMLGGLSLVGGEAVPSAATKSPCAVRMHASPHHQAAPPPASAGKGLMASRTFHDGTEEEDYSPDDFGGAAIGPTPPPPQQPSASGNAPPQPGAAPAAAPRSSIAGGSRTASLFGQRRMR